MADQPVNFEDIRESFELALQEHDISDDTINEIVATVEEAVANNEQHLMWRDDFDEFVSHVDGLCDSVHETGYEDEVAQIDDLRKRLEPKRD
ncbi:hypothetical protein [Halorientalis regularis]|uniref:Uncharacterized protein n=1 Tax=Halorientalis regularis TaxID=660518 RepID=A0A1G7SM08_9EURY|nr:hypothetical protein [Halorientalis regularis]SDG23469.1 hypothetical protein SAMN05216218_1198 [Halorientalis regularis]